MAYSVSATKGPTQLAGDKRVVSKKVSPDAATGNVTFSELTVVDAVIGVIFVETLTGNCYSADAQIDGTTTNQVNMQLWKAGGTAADTAILDFQITVLGH